MGILDGDIILLGDFNAQTGNHQTVFYNASKEMLRELDTFDMGLDRCSEDMECTEYERYLLDMGTAHELAILNGLQRFPAAAAFTCFPHRRGASIVDYILAMPSFLPHIEDFTVGPRPIGVAMDHALLTLDISFQFTMAQRTRTGGPTRYTLTSETNCVYRDGIYRRLCTEDPGRPLEELTHILTETLHDAAREAYAHTQPKQRRCFGTMPQNNWYDEECRELRARLQREVSLGVTTHRQSRIAFRHVVQRKKRAFLAHLEEELYQLFLSQDSAKAWRLFDEPSPTLAITSPKVWGHCAASLCTVLGQPFSLFQTHRSHAHMHILSLPWRW